MVGALVGWEEGELALVGTCVGSDDIGEIEIGDSLGQVLGELDGISVSSLPIWKGATKPPTSANASSALSDCKFRNDACVSNSGGSKGSWR